MTHNLESRPSRGGAPVGMLSELPAVELAAIQYLRLWFSGQPDHIWTDLLKTYDRVDAEIAMACFEDLMRSVKNHARRPIMRHSPTCECFGGDECAFAQMIAAASSGADHDAMTFALHLFKGVQAKCALGAAAMCGHAFRDMAVGQRISTTENLPRATHTTPILKQ